MTSPYKKEGIVFPRCTDIIGDCTDKSYALNEWSTGCVVEWIRENVGQEEMGVYALTDKHLDNARYAYKTVSKEALDVGSEVHDWIEKYLGSPDYPDIDYDHYYKDKTPEVFAAITAFLDWAHEHDLRPIEVEKTVYASRWAGTLDFYGYFNDKLYIIDWKTSKPRNKKTGKGIYPESRYQVAAYRSAMENNETVRIVKEYGDRKENGRMIMDVQEIQKHLKPIEGCGVLRLDKETGMPNWNDTSKTYEKDLRVFNAMVNLYFERHPIVAKRFEHLMPF